MGTNIKQKPTGVEGKHEIPYAKETAEELNLPLKAVTIPSALSEDEAVKEEMKTMDIPWEPVEIYVKAPWE